MTGGEGADHLDGRGGRDWVTFLSRMPPAYAHRPGVNVNLEAGISIGDGLDTLAAIENVEGTETDDTIRGDDFANLVNGVFGTDRIDTLGGNDVIRVGRGSEHDSKSDVVDAGSDDDRVVVTGYDTELPDFNGGDGIDTLVARWNSIVVDLEEENARYRSDEISHLMADVENVTAGRRADRLTGNDENNVLIGDSAKPSRVLDAGDEIDGRGGDDTLAGSFLNDTLIGGEGADSADGRNGNDECDAETEVNCER